MLLPNPQDLIGLMHNHIIKEIDDDTCLIGIPSGGEIILEELKKKIGNTINYGLIDTSYYRDDLDISGVSVKEKTTSIDFNINGKKVILIDDVFYTGRTVRAAINELFDFGRPKKISLYVLIDRQENELPIKPDFSAHKTNKIKSEYIDLIKNKKELRFKMRPLSE